MLCYSAMSHATNKSLEELRIEDYMSNRKVTVLIHAKISKFDLDEP